MENIHHEKTRWACRRGMLELDLFLVPFFENCYLHLTTSEQADFILLLNENDPQLLDYCMAYAIPAQKELADIVNKIRDFRLLRGPDSLF